MTDQKKSLMSEETILRLITGVAVLEQSVTRLVADAREERAEVREYRKGIQLEMEQSRKEQHAARMEQAALAQSVAGFSAQIGGLTATLKSLEDERKERVAVLGFAGKLAKVWWTVFGGSLVAGITYAWHRLTGGHSGGASP